MSIIQTGYWVSCGIRQFLLGKTLFAVADHFWQPHMKKPAKPVLERLRRFLLCVRELHLRQPQIRIKSSLFWWHPLSCLSSCHVDTNRLQNRSGTFLCYANSPSTPSSLVGRRAVLKAWQNRVLLSPAWFIYAKSNFQSLPDHIVIIMLPWYNEYLP